MTDTDRTPTDAELIGLILAVIAEGDGSDDDAPELDTAEGFRAAYPAADALARYLFAGGAVHDDAVSVMLTRHSPMHDAPWHVDAAALSSPPWRAHDTLAGACRTFAELAGLAVSE